MWLYSIYMSKILPLPLGRLVAYLLMTLYSMAVRDMDPFTEPYWDFLLQIHLFILQKHKSVSLLFLGSLCLGIVLQNVYFRYVPPFHVLDSLSYSNTTF